MAKKRLTVASVNPETDWQTQSDLSTLMEAHHIKADPKRRAKVQALAKQRMMHMAAVATGADGQPTQGSK